MHSTSSIINNKYLLDIYYNGLARKSEWESVIADDFQFVGGDMTNRKPIIGKQAYIDVIGRFSRLFTAMRVKEMFVHDQHAFVLAEYDYVFPNGKSLSGEVAEYWLIKNHTLAGLTIYFDTLTFYEWTSPLHIVMRYHEAWTNKAYQEAAAYLADPLIVIAPIQEYPDKTSYIQAVAQKHNLIRKVDLIGSFNHGDECMLLYDMDIKGFGNLRVAEYFKVKNGKIIQICQIHDTMPFRKA